MEEEPTSPCELGGGFNSARLHPSGVKWDVGGMTARGGGSIWEEAQMWRRRGRRN